MAEDFSGQNLRGRSFKGRDLTGANFSGTDIRGATFLHSWNIDNSTRLEGAYAAYVFLLDNYRDRRPSSGEFKKGEFSKLFQ